MAKKKDFKPQRELTRRQLTKWQQQKRRARIALIAGIVIIVAAIAVLGSGWYIERYQPLQRVVLKVNNTEFTMSYFIDMLKYYGRSQPEYIPYIADSVVAQIEQNELLRQGASQVGISVDDADIDKELEARKLGKEARDPVRAELLATALKDSYFDTLVPENGEQKQIQAIFLESESQANDIKARIDKGESFADLAGQLSLENYTKSNKGDLGWRPKDVLPYLLNSSVLENSAFNAPVGVLTVAHDADQSKNLGYLLVKLLDTQDSGKQAHIQMILVGSLQDAQKAKARIAAGEDFTAVAKEVSQLSGAKDNGGDMGWINPGTYIKQVDDFAFNPATPQFATSDPIKGETQSTKGGYWLFKVVGSESKAIEGENRDILKSKLFSDWAKGLPNDPNNKIENLLNDQLKQFAITQATKA